MIRVVLIEDDPMVLEVNKQFVERVPGFEIVGTASDGMDGLEKVRILKPDLVILDIYMPRLNGLDTLRQIRSEHLEVDAIAITAANDISTIQRMLHHGAVDYIMKPFQFERVRQALQNYQLVRSRMNKCLTLSQEDLDQLLHDKQLTVTEQPGQEWTDMMPKGLQEHTMKQVMLFLVQQQKPLSAEEVAEGVGLARVTARRYLEHLEKKKQVRITIEYGGVGRPVNRYAWVSEGIK